jgi:hypothetical protein
VLPLYLFWLIIMVLIWLYLLGWSRVVTGHFSPIEIAMTLVIGIASLVGLVRCIQGGQEVKPLVASGVFLLSAAFQFVTFRISLLPGIARR